MSLNIIRIKSRRMTWTGLVAYKVEIRDVHKILVGKLEETVWET
jgi:hypothetical protein